MDNVARYNIKRWNALAKAGAIFSLPIENLRESTARDFVDPFHKLGELKKKRVLCLGGGGGRQSIAFSFLGAEVTVLDISDAQLKLDADRAKQMGMEVKTIRGDMREMSFFDDDYFDIVDQPYSINFIPGIEPVLREVSRILCTKGIYQLMCSNSFYAGIQASDWDGHCYPLKKQYLNGAEIGYKDEDWVFRGKKSPLKINPAKEYRHTLSAIINGLVEQGFTIMGLEEECLGEPDFNSKPGTNNHFSSIAPPWLIIWSKKS